MKLRILNKLNLNKVLLFILIILFAYSVAGAMFDIMREKTLGSIFRHFLPTTPYLFLIILISLYDIRKISFSNLVPAIPSKHDLNLILKRFLLISFLAVLLGIFISEYLVGLGLLYVPVIIFVITGLIFSCYYMLMEKKILGVVIFLFVMPFLYFIQRNLGKILNDVEFEGLKISEIFIPLSAIYIFIISIWFFIAKYQSKGGNVHNEDRTFLKLCLIFGLVPVFSSILSKDSYHSFVYYLIDIILPLVYFLILMKSLRNLEDIKMFILALIISMFLYEFFALYFAYQMGSLEDITVGLYGSEKHAGFTAILIPLMIPFQIVIIGLIKRWQKGIITLILSMFLIYLFLANQRTILLASFVGLGVFFYFSNISTFKKTWLFISVSLVLILFFLFCKNLHEYLSYFRGMQTIDEILSGKITLDSLTSHRILIWESALKMIGDFPLFGIGPGMWSEYIPEYSRTNYFYRDLSGNIVSRYYASTPHNIYLEIYVNYGVISFVCYILMLYKIILIGIQNIKASTSKLMRTLSLGSLVSLTNWVTMGFIALSFFNNYHILYGIIFWSIVAIILKINSFTLKGTVENPTA